MSDRQDELAARIARAIRSTGLVTPDLTRPRHLKICSVSVEDVAQAIARSLLASEEARP